MCLTFVALDTEKNKSMTMNHNYANPSRLKMSERTEVRPTEATIRKLTQKKEEKETKS